MARLRGSVVLTPIPRDRFDEIVALAYDVVGEHLGGADLPLAGGEHLAPGSWYSTEDEEIQVSLDSWARDGESAGRINLTNDDILAILSVRLVSGSAPRSAELTADARSPRYPRMTKLHVDLRADLARWWTGVAKETGEPGIEGRGRAAVGRATFSLTPAPAPGGRWRVTVEVRLRARGLLSPFTGLALLFGRWWLRPPFAEGLTNFAAEWNRQVPELLAMSTDELRARVAAELTNAGKADDPVQ